MFSPIEFNTNGGAVASLPLPTLLSQVLVAFTIEFDNEFERQAPHRTSSHGPSAIGDGPWLVSMVMWSNFMRFVPEDGVTVGKLQGLTGLTAHSIRNWVTRLSDWWRYVVVAPDPTDSRPKPTYQDWIVRPTAGGRRAMEVWRPLFGVIEQRWCVRFGIDEIGRLRESLCALVDQFEVELPEYLPILGYGLFTDRHEREEPQIPDPRSPGTGKRAKRTAVAVPDSRTPNPDPRSLHLSALLSQALLMFTIEFERESDLSLAISANVLRLLGKAGVPVRNLPHLSGVSKEAVAMSVSYLEKHGFIMSGPDLTASRMKTVRLTPEGLQAQEAYRLLLVRVEDRWQARYGEDILRNLRESLELLVGEQGVQSPLFRGLEPPPEGWRASVRKPETLPHHPMVLHRGGFPDGA